MGWSWLHSFHVVSVWIFLLQNCSCLNVLCVTLPVRTSIFRNVLISKVGLMRQKLNLWPSRLWNVGGRTPEPPLLWKCRGQSYLPIFSQLHHLPGAPALKRLYQESALPLVVKRFTFYGRVNMLYYILLFKFVNIYVLWPMLGLAGVNKAKIRQWVTGMLRSCPLGARLTQSHWPTGPMSRKSFLFQIKM